MAHDKKDHLELTGVKTKKQNKQQKQTNKQKDAIFSFQCPRVGDSFCNFEAKMCTKFGRNDRTAS